MSHVRRGGWTGPAVFLAQAGVKFTVSDRLPEEARAILIHGEFDEVVHISGSVQLASSSPNATLVRVADGHRFIVTLANKAVERRSLSVNI